MVVTVLTHAIATILICGLAVWLIGFLTLDHRMKKVIKIIVIVACFVSIVHSLNLLAIGSFPPPPKITE